MRRLFCSLLVLASTALAGESDALSLHQRIRDRHMPYGMVMDPILAAHDSDDIVGYTRCGDSAIWTGHYLAAEAYRWHVTRSPEAYDNVMFALNGIRKLIDVTGTDVLARCAVPVDSPYAAGIASEEAPNTIRYSHFDDQDWLWVGNTSRDQYLGVFFGLTATWNLVQTYEAQAWTSMLATRMLQRLQKDFWVIRMPDGEITSTFLGRPDHQLALLKLGRRCNPKPFESAYKTLANLSAQSTVVPIALEVRAPYSSYFKFNLDHIAFYNLLTSGDNSFIRSGYNVAFDTLRRTTDDHQNAFFDMIDTAINGRDYARDQRVRANLSAWLQRDPRGYLTDLHGQVPTCDDDTRACSPIPVELRPPTDFLWQRSPFQLEGGHYLTIESAGIDYILPYWMARYHGVLTPAEP